MKYLITTIFLCILSANAWTLAQPSGWGSVHLRGQCMTASDESVNVLGSNVTVENCNGSNNQQWLYDSQGRFQSALDSELCIMPFDVFTEDGNIVTWACSDITMQRFTVSNGNLINQDDNRCLSVEPNSSNVYMQECDGTIHQDIKYFNDNNPAPIGGALMAHNTPATACFEDNNFDRLDYGLHWFGIYNFCNKALPGQTPAFYDKNKPTIIFVHGWQKNTVVNKGRSRFDLSEVEDPNYEDAAYGWRRKGWNVGILYWNQFADEGEATWAEAKIWSTQGPKGMRWLDSNGNYNVGPAFNITEILYTSIIDNMRDFNGPEFRIAGHSLGNQLALRLTERLHHYSPNPKLKPTRIALLDPFYSLNGKDYLNGQWTGEEARDIADNLTLENVLLESYRSSVVNNNPFAGDANTGLLDKTAFTELRPWYLGPFQFAKKHAAAWWWYFWSFNYSPPTASDGRHAMSASTEVNRGFEFMNGPYRLEQNSGEHTPTVGDDGFEIKLR